LLLLVTGGSGAWAAPPQHGVSLTKGCNATTPVGSPLVCSYTIRNNIDDAHDSLTINSLVDTVLSSPADVSGNLLLTSAAGLTTTTVDTGNVQSGSVCYALVRSGSDMSVTNGSGTVTSASANFTSGVGGDVGRQIMITGTVYTIASVTNGTTADLNVPYGSTNNAQTGTNKKWTIGFHSTSQDGTVGGLGPYTNVGFCELPFGSRVNVLDTSHHTVTANDYALSDHTLFDSASLSWNDECNGLAIGGIPGGGNCNASPPNVGAGSSTIVTQLPSTTATAIHDAAHSTVTTVEAGTTVHDSVSVTGQQGQAKPSGNVSIDWFTNGTCSGDASASSGSIGPLDASGNFDATAFARGPLAIGSYGFIAHYLGDGTYSPSDGPCEPLTVVDANIQITPATATNEVGHAHTLTGHVNVSSGSSMVNAPAGTQITFSVTSGAATFVGGVHTCNTIGSTGECTVQINSPTPGANTIKAATDVTVGGIQLHRETGDQHAGDSANANKTYVDANIQITPATATNEVGHAHTLTGHVNVSSGATFVNAPAGTLITFTVTSGTATFVGGNTCNTIGATGECTVQINSPTPGANTIKAATNVTVGGVSLHRETGDGLAGDSANASKTYVDANIQITPATATNVVGHAHTLTGHVNVSNGGGFVNAPAGTLITFTVTSGTATFVGNVNTCTTIGATGECTVQINSPTTGANTIKAATDVTVGGVSLHRETGDANAGDSASAHKTYVNAKISISPDATNEVGHQHTFTVTLLQDTGTGSFVPAAGQHVDVSLSDSNGANHAAPTGTCTNAGANTDANGQCTITFVSQTAGKVTGHAAATLSVLGSAPFTVQTDGTGGNSVDAVKTYVDANIQITPATATNEVGHAHTLTGHVNVNDGSGAGFVNAPAGTVITFTITSGSATFVAGNTCIVAGSTGSCSVQIDSQTAGTNEIKAATTLSVSGISLTRVTNGTSGNSGDALKTYVDANIQITPATATNEVGHAHALTGHVNVNDGSGAGLVNAPAGTTITFTVTSGTATFVGGVNTCTTVGTTGSCTVQINSPTPGANTIKAATDVTVGGLPLHRETGDQHAGDSPNAAKTYVDANIQISPPAATNEVGHAHTLTGHVNVSSGATFVNAPAGTLITFTVTSGTATFVGNVNTCTTVGATGSCSVQITSPTAGQNTIKAATNVTVGGLTLHRETGDGLAGDSANATKTYVDAKISITPNGTNQVGHPHTFTAHVQINDGSGAGFVDAPAGTSISFTIDNGGPGSFTTVNPCTVTSGGSCQITLSSNTTGATIVSAHWTGSVGGVVLIRNTDGTGGNSGPATKTFVNAKISIAPAATNEVTHSHTFTVTLQKDTGTGQFVGASGEHVSVTLTDSNGAAHTTPTGTCTNAGANTDSNGQCTITFTSATPGKVTGHATATLSLGPPPPATVTVSTDGTGLNSGDAVKTFVDSYITISPAVATNPTGVTHTFTATVFINDGSGTGYVTAPNQTPVTFSFVGGHVGGFTSSTSCTTVGGSCSVTDVSNTGGDDTVRATTTLTVGGVSMTRATGTSAPGHVNSSDALKHWNAPPPPSTPQTPAIAITKNPKSQTIASGATATWTIVVTNTGNVTLTNVHVVDPIAPDCVKTSAQIPALASMAPGASVTYNCSLGNITANLTNVATDIGTPPSGPDVSATDSAQVIVTPPFTPPVTPKPTPTHPAIDIVKDPKTQEVAHGGTATWKITVTNTGDVTLTDVTVTDPLATGCNRNLGTLGVGQSKSYHCTKPNADPFTNVATATGKPPTGANVSAKDHADVTAPFLPPQHPRIGTTKNPKTQTVTTELVTKTTSTGANQTTVTYGTASFKITVTNTGDVTLHSVRVTDPMSPNCNHGLGVLTPGQTKSYTCDKPAVTANYTNVETATGISPKGVHVHATDHARVLVKTKTQTSGKKAEFTG
jgi:uncharacterized repeat protein (TIGR01451 family)